MAKLRIGVLIALSCLFLVGCGSGGSGGGSGSGGGGSSSGNLFSGHIASVFDLLIPSAEAAAEGLPTVCDSVCTEVDQTKCVSFSIVNTDSSETLVCKTNLLSNNDYQFSILDKDFLVHKILKVSIQNFNGSSRELTTSMNETGLESRHDVSEQTTVNSGPILATLLRKKSADEDIGDEIEGIVLDVGGGNFHTCALLATGRIKCWGDNQAGVLGLGTNEVLKLGDESSDMGVNLAAINLGTNLTATQLAVGYLHNCAILSNLKLKCWGYNGDGSLETGGLGYGDQNSRGDAPGEMGDNLPYVDLGTGRTVKQVSIGHSFTCAVLDNNQVKCWGYNMYGALGLGLSFKSGSRDTTNNQGDDPGEMGDNLPYVNLGTGRTALKVVARLYRACALLDNSKLKCWGDVGSDSSGRRITLGDDPGEMGDNLPYIDLGAGRTVKDFAMDGMSACAILDNNQIKCWGENNPEPGVLGSGSYLPIGRDPSEMGDNLPYVDLGTGRTAKKLVMTTYGSACAILDNDGLKCWGHGLKGTLGYGDSISRGDDPGEMGDELPYVDLGTGRKAIRLGAGNQTVCAILDDMQLKCWGLNNQAQLGLGHLDHIGDGPDEMGDDLPYVNLSQ